VPSPSRLERPRVWERLALAPYLAVFYPFLVVRRAAADTRLGKGPWRTWVTPDLLVGGFLYPFDVDALVASGVGAVVNVSRELVEPRVRIEAAGLAYLQVPCWDGRVPSLPDAREGVDFIAQQIEAGRKVYVHCASGVGRSVSLVLCYLCAREGRGIDEAAATLHRLRPRVSLSAVQRGFVSRYLAAYPPPPT